MGRYTGPKHHLCRAEGVSLCGLSKCPVLKRNAPPPGQHGPKLGQYGRKGRKKSSDYAIQLRQKQKVKRIYGLREKQFKKYYILASKKKGATGETLLETLERRLDNVVFRLNLAQSRQQAHQLVSHGHILVNDKKVNISSYNVKIGDIIMPSSKAANLELVKKTAQEAKDVKLPSWLAKQATVGKVISLPSREDIDADIDERLIVEYYSR